ncbi:MAG: hypothetical protein WCG07_01770 [Candidatus Taylorbacteria bacterium]
MKLDYPASPIENIGSVYRWWAMVNKISTPYLSPDAHAKKIQRSYRNVLEAAVMSLVFTTVFVPLVWLSPLHGHLPYSLTVTYVISAWLFVYLMRSTQDFLFRKPLAPDVQRFHEEWKLFVELFSIDDLADYPAIEVLQLHVENCLRNEWLKRKQRSSRFNNMHEIALRFGLCRLNRFSFEPGL